MKHKTLLFSVAALLLVSAVLWPVHKSRTFQFFGVIVPRVDTTHKVVALTFDDGPSPETNNVLDILKQHDVKATFFLVGSYVEARLEDARKIAQAGHEIGNHSFSHNRMVLKSLQFYRTELSKTDLAIRSSGYAGAIHFRPPNGKKLFGLPYVLSQQGRKTIMWDIEPDSVGTPDRDEIARQTLSQVKPGSIILLHVMAPSRQASRDALTPIISELKSQGYRFVTVSQLLELSNVAR